MIPRARPGTGALIRAQASLRVSERLPARRLLSVLDSDSAGCYKWLRSLE
jgi:hypothetical protein